VNGVSARIVSYSPSDDKFTIQIRWRNTGNLAQPLIKHHILTHATCPTADAQLEPKLLTGRQLARDLDLEDCHRDSKNERVTFSLETNQGPMEPHVILPIYEPGPTGHCGPYCTSCSVVNNAYSCSSCQVKVAQLFKDDTDHMDLYQGSNGLRFSCVSMPVGQPYTVRAQGTIANNSQTTIRTGRYYVGDKTSDSQETVDWSMDAGYKIDGDDNFYKGIWVTQSTSKTTNAAWSDFNLKVPASGTIAGYIYVNYLVMSPGLKGIPLEIGRDFVISITPE